LTEALKMANEEPHSKRPFLYQGGVLKALATKNVALKRLRVGHSEEKIVGTLTRASQEKLIRITQIALRFFHTKEQKNRGTSRPGRSVYLKFGTLRFGWRTRSTTFDARENKACFKGKSCENGD